MNQEKPELNEENTELSFSERGRPEERFTTEINRHFCAFPCQMFCLPKFRRNNGMNPFTELAGYFIFDYVVKVALAGAKCLKVL